MTSPFEELSSRIRAETGNLQDIITKISHTWSALPVNQYDQDIYIDSIALRLHAVYTGLEKIFQLISRVIDEDTPVGRTWHRELLESMASDIPGRRPAVISSAAVSYLDELRRFRHMVRNVYTTNLDPARIKPLIDDLTTWFPQIKAELLAFSDFLEQLKP